MGNSIEKGNAPSIRGLFEHTFKISKLKLILNESDDAIQYLKKVFTDFSEKKLNKRLSRYISKGAIFSETINIITRDFLKKPFQKGAGIWIHEIITITKQCI